jgi:acyl-CoA synthetase (NDP forming)
MAFLGIAWSLISGGFAKLLGLLARIPWQVYAIAGTLLLAFLGIRAWDRHEWNGGYNVAWSQQHTLLVQDQAAFAKTVADYRTAADEAARLDKANVARVQTEQTTITERTVHDYQAQLATSADRYERLRAQAAGYLSHPSSAQAAGLPDDRETTCRAVAGAGCDAIPPLLKAAQDNTDQLVALQKWVAGQSAVNFGNEANP